MTIEISNKVVSAKDTDAYAAAQPSVSGIFEKHQELSSKRTVSHNADIWTYNHGTWRHWTHVNHRISRHSRKRIERLCRKYGTQIYHSQWEFPDRIECESTDQQVAKLGFWQYTEAKP
jgi:hypothetical protein